MIKIDKTNKKGLTQEQKEILKSMNGRIKSPLDYNKARDEWKYGKN